MVWVSAKIKIVATSEVVRTLKVYGKALQFCVNQAWKRGVSNNVRLHPFVYCSLRKKGLQSQLAVACIRQACGMVKKAKTKPLVRNCSMGYNFPRSASLKDDVLSLATVKGRQKFDIRIPDCYAEYFSSWRINEGLLRIDRKGRCFFIFSFFKEIESSNVRDGVLGIDFGINNLAVTSDRQFFKSGKVKQAKRRFRYLHGKLQAKGTKSARRLIKKISGREKRFMAWYNHNISKQIVSSFDGNKVVMENLKGMRKKNRGRKMNYWLNSWSFFQLQNFIRYKTEKKGITIRKVNPVYTSQLCSKCGKLGSRSKSVFKCLHCGYSLNADLNAALNLAHPKLAERQAAVNQPHIPNNDVKGTCATATEFRDNNDSKGKMPQELAPTGIAFTYNH